jgi:hypothetical protein
MVVGSVARADKTSAAAPATASNAGRTDFRINFPSIECRPVDAAMLGASYKSQGRGRPFNDVML